MTQEFESSLCRSLGGGGREDRFCCCCEEKRLTNGGGVGEKPLSLQLEDPQFIQAKPVRVNLRDDSIVVVPVKEPHLDGVVQQQWEVRLEQ